MQRLRKLRAAREGGVAVFTTYPRSIAAAVEAILKLGSVVGRPAEAGAMAREIASRIVIKLS